MQILVVKHIQLFCMTLFFTTSNTNCEQMLVSNEQQDRQIYGIAGCSIRCLEQNSKKNLNDCYAECSEPSTANVPINVINNSSSSLYKFELLCRNDTSLVLEFITPTEKSSQNDSVTKNSKKEENSFLYVVKVHQAIGHPIEQQIFLGNSSMIIIGNLQPNTKYNISASLVSERNEVISIINGMEISTLQKLFSPGIIVNVTIVGYELNNLDRNALDAVITWSPAEDMTCLYDLVLMSLEDDMELQIQDIWITKHRYISTFKNLSFDNAYQLGIRGMNRNFLKGSDLIWHGIKTPNCVEFLRNDSEFCIVQPEGLRTHVQHLYDTNFSFNISWNRTYPPPYYYTLEISDLYANEGQMPNIFYFNISKDETFFFIDNMTLNGSEQEICLTAYNAGGKASETIHNTVRNLMETKNRQHIQKLIIAIIAPILGLTLSSLLILVICHRRTRYKRYQERCKYFEELEKKAPVDPNSNFEICAKTFPLTEIPCVDQLSALQLELESKLFINDEMEVDRESVQLVDGEGGVLGEGAFGVVRKGILLASDRKECDVAVKMLKDHPSVDDIREFHREIEVMKSVGKHTNIVTIIGHCTRNLSELWLLTEFCSRGNLLDYLRFEWNYINKIRNQTENLAKKDCFTPSPIEKSENAFNFDTSFVDKFSVKYKNIETDCPSTSDDIRNVPKNLIINQLYEYNQTICTNSCKCHVDVMTSEDDKKKCLENSESVKTLMCGSDINDDECKIRVKSCDCKIKKMRSLSVVGEDENITHLLVENEGYYKLLEENKKKEKNSDTNDNDEKSQHVRITRKDLLEIARQIATGMEFLAKNKVVHRDLAARNVLVSADRTVKIADFGLSRDIYRENMYKKTGAGKLPIKWLAIESMTHQVYTSQSDVWSYGILLHEIVTLGGSPYPSVPTNRLLKLLRSGYRMERPKNCSQAFYSLMRSCWHDKPAERPTFTEISQILDNMLLDGSLHKKFIDLELNQDHKILKSVSDESYLKPLL